MLYVRSSKITKSEKVSNSFSLKYISDTRIGPKQSRIDEATDLTIWYFTFWPEVNPLQLSLEAVFDPIVLPQKQYIIEF